MKPLFDLGYVVATGCAALALARAAIQPEELLERHRFADFGEVDDARRKRNEDAINRGGRIESAYLLPTGEIVIVVTEKGSTSLLTPSELDQPWE